jgi:hypothetical protein
MTTFLAFSEANSQKNCTKISDNSRYSHDTAVLLQPSVVNLVTLLHVMFIMTVSNLLEQPCDKSDNAIIHQACYKLLTACFKLVTTTGNKQCEDNFSTACEQICNNLFADL